MRAKAKSEIPRTRPVSKIASKTHQPSPPLRQAVRDLLTQSAAFSQLLPGKQSQIAHDTAVVVDYLASPARNLTEEVDFPAFVSSLLKGVFKAIVNVSVEQMKAYGKLVAAVSKSLDKFRDENVSENEARDHLVKRVPDLHLATTAKKKPAAVKRLATQRQQLLATMVMMGINRIVVTSGKIDAKISSIAKLAKSV
jgi:hypothetical protein